MSVDGRRLVVGTDQVRVDPASRQFWAATLTNRSSVSLFLAKDGVTTTTGYELLPGASIPWQLGPTDKGLYAIAATAGNRLDIAEVIN